MKYNAPSHYLLHYFSNLYLQCKTIHKYEMLTFICVIIYLNPSIEYFSFYHEVLKKNIGVCDLLHVDTVLKSIFTFIFNFLVFFILVAFRLCFYTFRLKNSIFHFCSVNIFLHYFHCLILTYLF